MTIKEFAEQLENFWHRGKSEDPRTFKVGCALPFNLWSEANEIASLLPQFKVRVKTSVLGFDIELTR